MLAEQTDIAGALPPSVRGDLDEASHVRLVRAQTSICATFMGNLFDGPCTQRAVRQALNYALNVPDLIKTVAGEAALPLTGPLPSGFDPETPGYTYDPRRARDLLHQAGCGPTLGITLDVPTTLPDTELAKRMAESYTSASRRISSSITTAPPTPSGCAPGRSTTRPVSIRAPSAPSGCSGERLTS